MVPQWASIVEVAQETGPPVEYLRLNRNFSFVDVKKQLAASTAAHTPQMATSTNKAKS